jgi:hypothetical protein
VYTTPRGGIHKLDMDDTFDLQVRPHVRFPHVH